MIEIGDKLKLIKKNNLYSRSIGSVSTVKFIDPKDGAILISHDEFPHGNLWLKPERSTSDVLTSYGMIRQFIKIKDNENGKEKRQAVEPKN